MRILTAIPVYNEASHIEPVLSEVLRYASDVLVIDDGSTDGTPSRLEKFPEVRVLRRQTNLGYGAGLRDAFQAAVSGDYDGLVTLDCDGQHEPALIPDLIEVLDREKADIVSGSRYLKVFDPDQKPPTDRRHINQEITKLINERLGFSITDAFCGFKAYATSALAKFRITDLGYAMPLQVWVQAAWHALKIVEHPVPLIYLDESRAFGGALDDADYRYRHYLRVFEAAMTEAGLTHAGSP